MDRRNFLSGTSAGLTAMVVAPGIWSLQTKSFKKKRFQFRDYRKGQTMAPVTCVTPDDGFYLHTFYDVCPWSPSEKYLAVTKFPYQGKKPVLGDIAEVCVIDLENQAIKTIYKTKAWSFQLGANLQWAGNDKYLYTNDVINYVAVCVKIDIETGKTMAYAGPKYDINQKGTTVVGSRLELINATQYGYSIPDDLNGFPMYSSYELDYVDGLWLTSLKDNQKKLLLSYAEIRASISDTEYYKNGIFYFFHSKFNTQGDKILQVVRCLIPGKDGRNPSLFTFDKEENKIYESLNRKLWKHRGPLGAGNHPNWHPDGKHIIMNLVPGWEGDDMVRFCMFKFDGSEKRVLSSNILGSGHPSVEPNTRYLITDAYPHQEWVALENGEVPIRLIDLENDKEDIICTIFTDLVGRNRLENYKVKGGGSHFKLDPHPAWSRDYKKVCFNGMPEDKRQVFIADLRNVLK